jgi:hypothetical protein
MIGEKYYGSNASTFVGVAASVLGSVSLIASALTAGELQILTVGSNAIAGALVSVSAIIIGGALVASRETVGGVTSILLAATLVFGGMVSINMGNFFRVLSGTSDAISRIQIDVKGVAPSIRTGQMKKLRSLNAAEQAECDEASALVSHGETIPPRLDWTQTTAGKRNCTGKGVYGRGGV